MGRVHGLLSAAKATVNMIGFNSPNDLNALQDSAAYRYILGVAFYQDDNGNFGSPGIDPNNRV
jgi:hypothetical protein